MRPNPQHFSEVFNVSPARSEDVSELKRIEVECMLSPWTPESYVREITRDGSVVLKAEDPGGSIMGFILGRAATAGEAAIFNIGTAAAFRRMGVGSLLLEEFRKQCVARGSTEIWLEVRETNDTAINFYLARGFVRRGIRPNFYSNPTDNALIMSLTLQPR